MDKKPLIGISICAVVLLVLGSLSNVVGHQSVKLTAVSNSPLFSTRIQRAIRQQLNIIISQYPGEGMGFENDTTPPVTTCILNPSEPDGENGWYVSNITVTLNATDNESGVNVTFYKIDNGGWETYTHPIVMEYMGIHVFQFYSVDNAGNVEAEKTTPPICIDKTAPLIAMNHTWEKIGPVYNIIVTATCSDAISGMNRVEFYFNGGLQETVSGAGPDYVWVYQYILLRNVIKGVAYDNAGNFDESTLIKPYSSSAQSYSHVIQFLILRHQLMHGFLL